MTTLVVFGAGGDLAGRLIFPALCRLEARGLLDGVHIVGYGLESFTDAEFVAHVGSSVSIDGSSVGALARLVARLSYRTGDLSADAVGALRPDLADENVYYLALPPGVFPTAAGAIVEAGLTHSGSHRLVVEKPFGTDRSTAAELNRSLHEHWAESQIFRIDHFLGKETVQNLAVMRFANRVLEPLLCATHVDQVQITVAETIGVEGRYRYYDGIGALRDMVQNHLMQLFCLAAMDPPALWDPEILRDHKVEVLRSVRTPTGVVNDWAARGQYGPGSIDGTAVEGYRGEPGIGAASNTDTFAAIRLQVDNWRWQGVPFYLRSGKRLAAPVSEIAYRFREPPTHLFHRTALAEAEPNWLVFRLNAPEGVDLLVQTKMPGLEMSADRSRLHVDYGSGAETTAYEQLLLDVLQGDHTPFIRVDEVDEAWRLLDPVLRSWSAGSPESYASGTDGPHGQDRILLDGHRWRPLAG
jgi:glucose-6-phosphate 1-dehydrogenase